MINIFEPVLPNETIELLKDVFKSKWLGRGTYVDEFEKNLSNFLSVNFENIHTISCCTDGIFGVFKIYDLPKKSDVIIPSISFPALASAVIAADLNPKIIDVDVTTGNICLNSLSKLINENTSAVFITHYGGIPVDIEQIKKIVGNNIFIFEDAACAFGTTVDGIACGTQSDFGCWSFDAMKFLTCGEGGAIHFPTKELSQKAKEYFYLGLPLKSKSGIDNSSSENKWWEYQLNYPGERSIFTNINAAIGLPQFKTINNSLKRKELIRKAFMEILDKYGVSYIKQEQKNTTYSNYFFSIDTKKRDSLGRFLRDNNIYSTFRYYPLHKIKIFEKYAHDCIGAEEFSKKILNIPIHHNLSDSDVTKICDTLENFFK